MKFRRIQTFGVLKTENDTALKKKSQQPSKLCYVQCQEKFFPQELNPQPKQKSCQTLMPSAPLTKPDNIYQVGSRSTKSTVSVLNESMANLVWSYKHPSIQDNFYLKIEAPADADDARIKMSCHQHAVKDFDLQLEMNDLEIDMLKDQDQILPYNETRADELDQKKLKLLLGKRFHQNAMNAYWYYLAKMGK